MRRFPNTRALTAAVTALALSGVWAGAAQADQLGYVADETAGTVTQVDLTTGTLGTPIAVGSEPVAVAITPNGSMAYVADYGSSEVVPVVLETGQVESPIVLSDRPSAIAISPDGKTAYVISGNGREWPITLATNKLGNPTTVPANSDAVAITPDGTTAYITNASDGTLTPFTISSGSVGQPIDLSSPTPDGIAITPDGSFAYVVSNTGDTITPVDLENGVNGESMELPAGSEPTSIAITNDGSTAYVTDGGTGQITPIELFSGYPETPITVGGQPSALALAPASGITTVPPPSSTGSDSTTTGGANTTTLGNQKLTVTVTPAPGDTSTTASACHAASSTLGVTLKRTTIKHAAKLKFSYAKFVLGKLSKRAKRLPATEHFSLRGLKSGSHTVTVHAYYIEQLARAGHKGAHKVSVTISKTLKTSFSVC